MVASAITKGEIVLNNIVVDHLQSIIAKLRKQVLILTLMIIV